MTDVEQKRVRAVKDTSAPEPTVTSTMSPLMASLEDVKRTKADLEHATDAMHKASLAHQEAVKKATDLKRDFDISIAELIPSTRIAKAS